MKDKLVQFRCSATDYALMEHAASQIRLGISQWVRMVAVQAAQSEQTKIPEKYKKGD